MRKLLLFLLVTIMLFGCSSPQMDPVETDYITVEVYWSSHCPYCFWELVVLEEISQELVGHPYLEGKVKIIANNIDLTAEELQSILGRDLGFTMTTGSKLPSWSQGVPTIIVRDTQGKMAFQWIGFASKAQLYSMIMETLGFIEKV